MSLADKVNKLAKTYRSVDEPNFIKTGSLVMDALLGGGVPEGCFILWSSQSGIGKSTGSLFIARSFCMQGKKVLYLDFEGGVNKSQLVGIGLAKYKYDEKLNPTGTFFVYQVHTFTDAETFLDELIEDMDLVVIDSVTAMLPSKLIEKSVEDVQPGIQARIMAGLLLKYKARSMKNSTSWIMINQVRMHIRFVGQTTEEEAGGNALKFYSDYRLLMKEQYKGKLEKEEKTAKGLVKVPYGSLNDIWCLKSRYSRPFIPLTLAVTFGKGIDNNYAYRDFLDQHGCIKKTGSWYEVQMDDLPKVKVQGDLKVIDWIQENRDAVKKYVAAHGGFGLIMDNKDAIEPVDALSSEELDPEGLNGITDDEYVTVAVGSIEDEGYNVADNDTRASELEAKIKKNIKGSKK
jgi:recombination protein RecA